MAKLTLEEFQDICQHNLDKRHVQEVLEATTNSEYRFEPGIVQPQDRIASLYKLRLQIVKEKETCDLNFLNDYERTVSNLQMSSSPNLAITALFVQGGGFIVFYEPDTKTILGVIKGRTGADFPIESNET